MITTDSPRRGMTIVELLVTMVIGSIVLLLAAATLGRAGNGYERIRGFVASNRELRIAIPQLSSDCSNAVFHQDEVFEKSTGSWAMDRLGILSLQPDIAQTDAGKIGDLCAIHYYVKDLAFGSQTVRCLMRGFRESGETFDALRENRVATLFTQREDVDEPIAFGVVSFAVQPRSRDAKGLWFDWKQPSASGPESLQVKVIFARSDLTKQLKSSSDWDRIGSKLGKPVTPERSPDLEVCETPIRFGNHAIP